VFQRVSVVQQFDRRELQIVPAPEQLVAVTLRFPMRALVRKNGQRGDRSPIAVEQPIVVHEQSLAALSASLRPG
jgi:hypothetical protein